MKKVDTGYFLKVLGILLAILAAMIVVFLFSAFIFSEATARIVEVVLALGLLYGSFWLPDKILDSNLAKNVSLHEQALDEQGFIINYLFSAVTLIQDERTGLFIPLTNSYRLSCKLTSMAAPVFMSAVSGLITIFVTSNWTGFWKEITFMFIYTVAIVIFGYLCKMAVRDSEVLCGYIPFFILGSLIFSPVFIDVTKWIPETAPIKYLFLPYYYLKQF